MSTTSDWSESSAGSHTSSPGVDPTLCKDLQRNNIVTFTPPPGISDTDKQMVDMIIVGLDKVLSEAWAIENHWKQTEAPTPEQSALFETHVLEIERLIYPRVINRLGEIMVDYPEMKDTLRMLAQGFRSDDHECLTKRQEMEDRYTERPSEKGIAYYKLHESFPKDVKKSDIRLGKSNTQLAVFEEDLRWMLKRGLKGNDRVIDNIAVLLRDSNYLKDYSFNDKKGIEMTNFRRKFMVNFRANMYNKRTIGTSQTIYDNNDLIKIALSCLKGLKPEGADANWFKSDSRLSEGCGKVVVYGLLRTYNVEEMSLLTGLKIGTLRWVMEKVTPVQG